MEKILETPRLLLRKFTQEDLSLVLEVIGDPEVMRFSTTGPEDEYGGRKFLESCLRRYERDGMGQWAIILKESGQLIGECGISVQVIDNQREFEISYRVLRSLWGKGFGFEAAIACREYGFKFFGLKRLISIIESANEPSIRVAQKMGMNLEKKSTFSNVPVEIYAIERKSSHALELSDFVFRDAMPDDIFRMKQIRDAVKENPLVSGNIEIDDYRKALFQDGKGWVCLHEGRVIGFSCGRIVQKDVWAIFIEQKYEGRGIGNKLMELLENWMFLNGCTEIMLSTDPHTRADRLYRKRGWQQVGVLPNKEVEFRLRKM